MRLLLATLLAVLLASPSMAQGESDAPARPDAQLWLSTSTEFKPFKKKAGQATQARFFRNLRATGELGCKLNENASSFNQFNLDGGLRYPLLDFLRVGAQYRYSMRDRYTTNRHRLDLQLWLKHKPGRWKTDYRLEYEHSFREVQKLRTVLRNRIGLGYNIPKWKYDPFVSVESFTALHYTGNRLVGMRYDLGTELDLNKKKTSSLEVAIRHDRELNMKEPEHAWILVLALETSFKRK